MHVGFDVEVYPNFFSCVMGDGKRNWAYEISDRRNDAAALYHDLTSGQITRMYGFNSAAYDYPLLHRFAQVWSQPPAQLTRYLYACNEELIAVEFGKGWQNHIWPRDQLVEQCDLMMLNHFDNVAKLTSLKDLQFNLAMPNVAETPIPFGTELTHAQMDEVLRYNHNDTETTCAFIAACMDAIKFREQLIADGIFGPECLNYNDVKIGEKFFIQRLERAAPGITRNDQHGRKPQTHRAHIHLGNIILSYVQFERPELCDLLGKLKDTVINGHETKGAYSHKLMLDDVQITIGAGGIHGSLDRHVVHESSERMLIDIDVRGYYPSVAIENGFYPAHIGPIFTKVYRDIRDERKNAQDTGQVAKAGGLKLANNGAFGKTNDKHSVLLDPQCMMAITVNGQLLQCYLAEALLRVPGLRLLQLNTDGLTVDLPRSQRDLFDQVCAWWQRQTCLELEFTTYSDLWLRDVNNYIARSTCGKVKRKGAYDHEMVSGSIGGQKAWNKDFSALVVPKAAEAAFLHDHDPADFIANHNHAYDFAIRERVKGGAYLMSGHTGERLGKMVRYYIATSGEPLVKMMPPLKGKTEWRRVGIHAEGQAEAIGGRKNWACSMCGSTFVNKAMFDEHNRQQHAWPIKLKMQWDNDLSGIDQRWYVQETERLLF